MSFKLIERLPEREILESLTQKVKSVAVQEGANVVAIAPAGRFGIVPEGHTPTGLLATAASVISIGIRIPAPITEKMPHNPHYPLFGYHLINHLRQSLTCKIATLLGDEGSRALPITPTLYCSKPCTLSEGKL